MIVEDNLEEPGYAKIVLVKTFWVKDGSVFVYDVEPHDMYLGGFYLATFDNLSDEQPYGIGPSIEDALQSATEQWNKYAGADDEADEENPFEEALNQLKGGE